MDAAALTRHARHLALPEVGLAGQRAIADMAVNLSGGDALTRAALADFLIAAGVAPGCLTRAPAGAEETPGALVASGAAGQRVELTLDGAGARLRSTRRPDALELPEVGRPEADADPGAPGRAAATAIAAAALAAAELLWCAIDAGARPPPGPAGRNAP